MNNPKISIIVAVDKNRGIGFKNKIPWNIPADMKHFREITKGHTVIMGKATFESILDYIGKPLPNRTNIVLTLDKLFHHDGCIICYSIPEALEKTKELEKDEAFIIGGASVYKQLIQYAEKLYITRVDGDFKVDTYFPDYSEFNNILKEESGEDNGYKFTWLELEREACSILTSDF